MKRRLFCPHLPAPGTPALLAESEAHHATHVLRLRDGDQVEAIDGTGHSAQATLRTRGGPPRLEHLQTIGGIRSASGQKTPVPIVLEVALLKGDSMEWVIEKAVELGVQQLTPVITDRSVVQVKNKTPEFFRDRWSKIADQALKQCGRLERMEISLPIPLSDLVTSPHLLAPHQRIWCDESAGPQAPFLADWLQGSPTGFHILIGPEGGWSPTEREILIQSEANSSTRRIHLGPLIMRAETAALFAVSVVASFVRSNAFSPKP